MADNIRKIIEKKTQEWIKVKIRKILTSEEFNEVSFVGDGQFKAPQEIMEKITKGLKT